jgi:hypothetical protein
MLASGVAGNVGTAGFAAGAAVVDWPATYVVVARATRAKRVEGAIIGPIEWMNRRRRCRRGI